MVSIRTRWFGQTLKIIATQQLAQEHSTQQLTITDAGFSANTRTQHASLAEKKMEKSQLFYLDRESEYNETQQHN